MRLPGPRRCVGWLAALVLLAMSSLAACETISVPLLPSPTQNPVVRATPTPNGCLTQHAPARWPAPDMIVTGPGIAPGEATPGPDGTRLVTVAPGQRLDFRLASGIKWRMVQAPSAAILQAEAPAGWYDAPHTACDWGYRTLALGATELAFTGAPICVPGQACPQYLLLLRYEVVVR